ncbi:barstar family protein [Geobacter sp. DSM 9736]|uniref:barstar family protein n=1 Tax=Geobacter sp. DSM 9736 TaxID=1277350 RepID=UPI000B508D38|nr:barstar family protein [Geobacter sp. DSM 9736]SNB46274.1 ribonuclease inhibitor [Geobacter sp. DSM 9736]
MPVTRCVLDGRKIRSLDDLYDELARQLPFPDHFGRNLDALWDVLSSDIEGPMEVVWEDSGASRQAMRGDFDKVADLLREVEEERGDFRVIFGK